MSEIRIISLKDACGRRDEFSLPGPAAASRGDLREARGNDGRSRVVGLLRFAFFAWAASVPRPRAACFELGGRRGPLALYALGAPFLLAALSAIALAWVQFVLGEGGKRRSGLEGDCLLAFAVWNGCYAVLAAASALALASIEAPDAARAVARVQLAYEAVVAAVQGAAYVVFGARLLERLDRMTGAKADARVDQFRGRVRRLLLCAGAGSLAVAACAALSAALPPTPATFFAVAAVGRRAVEALLAVAASAFGLRASAAVAAGPYFPLLRGLARRGPSLRSFFFGRGLSWSRSSSAEGSVELGDVYGDKVAARTVFSPMGRDVLLWRSRSSRTSSSESSPRVAARVDAPPPPPEAARRRSTGDGPAGAAAPAGTARRSSSVV